MVEVTVARLGLDSTTNSYVVILRETNGTRLLPIWIGQPEAESIVNAMNHVTPARPNAHDLGSALLRGLGATLRRVLITRVEHRTYFAELQIEGIAGTLHIDARPSDSIAVALRVGAPIFAPADLLSDAHVFDATAQASIEAERVDLDQRLDAEQLKSYLERLRPEDFGKFNP